MAGTTGLEPATSAVTGQRSNQLSYVPTLLPSTWLSSALTKIRSFRSLLSYLLVCCFESDFACFDTSTRSNLSLEQLSKSIRRRLPLCESATDTRRSCLISRSRSCQLLSLTEGTSLGVDITPILRRRDSFPGTGKTPTARPCTSLHYKHVVVCNRRSLRNDKQKSHPCCRSAAQRRTCRRSRLHRLENGSNGSGAGQAERRRRRRSQRGP